MDLTRLLLRCLDCCFGYRCQNLERVQQRCKPCVIIVSPTLSYQLKGFILALWLVDSAFYTSGGGSALPSWRIRLHAILWNINDVSEESTVCVFRRVNSHSSTRQQFLLKVGKFLTYCTASHLRRLYIVLIFTAMRGLFRAELRIFTSMIFI